MLLRANVLCSILYKRHCRTFSFTASGYRLFEPFLQKVLIPLFVLTFAELPHSSLFLTCVQSLTFSTKVDHVYQVLSQNSMKPLTAPTKVTMSTLHLLVICLHMAKPSPKYILSSLLMVRSLKPPAIYLLISHINPTSESFTSGSSRTSFLRVATTILSILFRICFIFPSYRLED